MMRHKENPLTFYRTKGGKDCDADYADFVVLHDALVVVSGSGKSSFGWNDSI